MKRIEIEEQIRSILSSNETIGNATQRYFDKDVSVNQLTDLFIQLSEERCQEQVQIVFDEWTKTSNIPDSYHAILNAPFPTLD